MGKSVALLVFALVLVGCGSHDRMEELQQQKLTLELMKVQNEQLAALKKTLDPGGSASRLVSRHAETVSDGRALTASRTKIGTAG